MEDDNDRNENSDKEFIESLDSFGGNSNHEVSVNVQAARSILDGNVKNLENLMNKTQFSVTHALLYLAANEKDEKALDLLVNHKSFAKLKFTDKDIKKYQSNAKALVAITTHNESAQKVNNSMRKTAIDGLKKAVAAQSTKDMSIEDRLKRVKSKLNSIKSSEGKRKPPKAPKWVVVKSGDDKTNQARKSKRNSRVPAPKAPEWSRDVAKGIGGKLRSQSVNKATKVGQESNPQRKGSGPRENDKGR